MLIVLRVNAIMVKLHLKQNKTKISRKVLEPRYFDDSTNLVNAF